MMRTLTKLTVKDVDFKAFDSDEKDFDKMKIYYLERFDPPLCSCKASLLSSQFAFPFTLVKKQICIY